MMWCNCKLTVKGSRAALHTFVTAAKGFTCQYQNEAHKQSLARLFQTVPLPRQYEIFCFHALVPVPMEKLQEEYNEEWELKNWGCKFGAFRTKFRSSPMANKVYYEFRTLNKAPIALFNTVSIAHPKLKFVLKYDTGVTKWHKGVQCE